jgi:hypothetical protein
VFDPRTYRQSTLYLMLLAASPASPSASAPLPARTPARKPSCSQFSVHYVNRDYRFRVDLPASWAGYSVITRNWEGDPSGIRGPLLLIRHPKWTEDDPREDVPIEVFAYSEWGRIQSEKLIVSAAPFPPGEIARNRKYIIAEPPRWSSDELNGVEEVGQILGCVNGF